jgi:hypothetical protein
VLSTLFNWYPGRRHLYRYYQCPQK